MVSGSRKTWLACSAALAALSLCTQAAAQVRRFDIPSQDAATAVTAFGLQAGVQISAPMGQLKGVKTPSIRGDLDARAALVQLLAGTGLVVARDDGRTIVLQMRPQDAAAADQVALEPNLAGTSAQGTDRAVDQVTVTAPPQAQTRVEIDRRSYDVTQSIQAQSGTLADLLRTIPSVEVDAQGSVSLRGDRGVVIMVDGKPSGMFRGEARASAVQSLPADQFERVEIISNPTAADSPEGVGGVINLVSKRTRGGGFSGSLRGGGGTLGQYNAGLGGTYNSAKLTVTGDVSVRAHDPQYLRLDEVRRQTISPGVTRAGRQVSVVDGSGDTMNGRFGLDYDLDDRTRIGGQVRGLRLRQARSSREHLEAEDTPGGPFVFDTFSDSIRLRLDNQEIAGTLRRKLGDDQELTAELRRESLTLRHNSFDRWVNIQPAAPDLFLRFFSGLTSDTTGAKADYTNPTTWGELKLGYEGQFERNSSELRFNQGPDINALPLIPGRSGTFEHHLDVNEVYATVSRKFGDITGIVGLRVSGSETTVTTAGQRYAVDLLRPYPSLHLSFPLGADTKLSASYGRRLQRPSTSQLSPLVLINDRQTLSQGNPLLRPQETDSFEVAYDTEKDGASLSATLFYRRLEDAFTIVAQDYGAGVILFTQENLGEVHRSGLSLAVTRRLLSKLSLNASGDGYWTDLPASAFGVGAQSGWVVGGRGTLIWTPSADDTFQLEGRAVGKLLTPQGYASPVGVLNLGYRRKLTPSLFVNLTAQNLLDSNRGRFVLRSQGLDYTRKLEAVGRMATVTLTYNFGGGSRRPRDPAFDFSASVPRSPVPD